MSMFRAFKSGPYRILWTSVILVQLGFWLATIAFQHEVAARTDNDAWQLGLLYFCTFAPYLLLSLPAGAMADSTNRRRMLLACEAAAAVAAVVCVVLAVTDAFSTAGLMMTAFAVSCAVTCTSPPSHALIANSVPSADMGSAVPLQSVALNLGRIFGPVLAAPALIWGGTAGAFAVFAVMFAVAVFLGFGLPNLPQVVVRGGESVFARVRAGIRHARKRPPAMMLLAINTACSIFAMGFQSQLPIIGDIVSGGDNSAFLTLIAIGGIGALVGVLTVARRRTLPTVTSTALQLCALGLMVAGLGLATSFVAVAIICCVIGGVAFSILTSVSTILQSIVEDAQRGRIMSLYLVSWGGVLPFGGLGLGALIRTTNISIGLATFGGVAALIGLTIAFASLRSRPAPN